MTFFKQRFLQVFPAVCILPAAGILLAVGLLLSGCGKAARSDERLKEATVLQEKLGPLEEEKKNLQMEIGRRKREEGLLTKNTGVGELIVLGADQELFMEVVPLVRKYSTAPATFAFSKTDFPGMPGKFTLQELRNMRSEGWTACLYWDGTEDLEAWLAEMEELFRKNSEPFPEALVFAEGTFDPALDPVLLRHGIRTGIHHGENDLSVLSDADIDLEVWHPGACGYYDMVARQKQDYLEQAEDLQKNIIYTVCVAAEESTAADAVLRNSGEQEPEAASRIFDSGSAYEEHPFAQFMGYWDKDTRDNYLTPKELYKARDYLYRCSLPESEAELLDDEIRKKRERIDEIDAEIRALYEEYGKNTDIHF